MLTQRSYTPEIIDLGPSHYTLSEYEDCLQKLDRVGRWLGGHSANIKALDRLPNPPTSILDVGCGSGDFTILMAQRYPQAQVLGIELNPLAIAHAQRTLSSLSSPPKNVQFRYQTTLNDPPQSYDVVITTLVCHHMDDPTLIDFLKKATSTAKKKVIINDLHRHPFALWSFQTLAPLFFRNRLVQHDGAQSIRRAFTRQDWIHYLDAAGIPNNHYNIRWQWAFRWIIEIEGNTL